jgi:hypothetical protein
MTAVPKELSLGFTRWTLIEIRPFSVRVRWIQRAAVSNVRESVRAGMISDHDYFRQSYVVNHTLRMESLLGSGKVEKTVSGDWHLARGLMRLERS